MAVNQKIVCTRCPISEYRTQIVLGRGEPERARFLFIGEAPGVSEDVLGKAFVGRSGKLLDAMITDAGIDLSDVFLTHCILCRPCDYLGGPNREPTNTEILFCIGNVHTLIKRIPEIERVVLIGKVAERYWAREFPKDLIVKIQHPAFILHRGGKSGPDYLPNVRVLKGLVE